MPGVRLMSQQDYLPFAVTITSDHPNLHGQLPDGGLAVSDFPFAAGRPAMDGERAPATPIDLAIPDERPYRVSRVQFTLVADPEGVVIVDGASARGTVVNGVVIGRGASHQRALLGEGSHDIIPGGVDSPYRLSLVVEPVAAPQTMTAVLPHASR